MKTDFYNENLTYKDYHGPSRAKIFQRIISSIAIDQILEDNRALEAQRKRDFEESEIGKQHRASMLKLQEQDKARREEAKQMYSKMIEHKNEMISILKKDLNENSTIEEIEAYVKTFEETLSIYSKTFESIKRYLEYKDLDPNYLFFKEVVKFNLRFSAFAPKEVLLLTGLSFSKLNEEELLIIKKRYQELDLLEDEKVKKYYTKALNLTRSVKEMDLDEARPYCAKNPKSYLELSDKVKKQLKDELNFTRWCQYAPATLRYMSKSELERFASISARFGVLLVEHPEVLENPNFDNKFFVKHDVGLIFQSPCSKKLVKKVLSKYFDRFPVIEKYCSIPSTNRALNSEYNIKTHF